MPNKPNKLDSRNNDSASRLPCAPPHRGTERWPRDACIAYGFRQITWQHWFTSCKLAFHGHRRKRRRRHNQKSATNTRPCSLSRLFRLTKLNVVTDSDAWPLTNDALVRFRSERSRDTVYKARGQLKEFNHRSDPVKRIFVNEDLTARRANIAFETRKLKKEKKIADCWTFNGRIIIKFNRGQIEEISSLGGMDHLRLWWTCGQMSRFYSSTATYMGMSIPISALYTIKCTNNIMWTLITTIMCIILMYSMSLILTCKLCIIYYVHIVI